MKPNLLLFRFKPEEYFTLFCSVERHFHPNRCKIGGICQGILMLIYVDRDYHDMYALSPFFF